VPVYVDARKIFKQADTVSGTVPVALLPRIQQVLVSDQADIRVELKFLQDDSKQCLITGQLTASLEIRCQRCLEPMRLELQDPLHLAWVRTQAEAERLDDELDPWISDDYKLELAPLLEEQLMLCMPIVSYHPRERCQRALPYRSGVVDETLVESADDNPFAVLESLKDSD